MGNKYSIVFNKVDEDITREYTMIKTSTMRARSVMLKMFNTSDNSLNKDSLLKLYDDEEALNLMMKIILVGDHNDISFFDCNYTIIDGIITDFFTSFSEKIKQ